MVTARVRHRCPPCFAVPACRSVRKPDLEMAGPMVLPRGPECDGLPPLNFGARWHPNKNEWERRQRCLGGSHHFASRIRARMSSTRQAVIPGPSLAGFGNRPALTPCHQVDLLNGIGPLGGRIPDRRRKPVSGRSSKMCCLDFLKTEEILTRVPPRIDGLFLGFRNAGRPREQFFDFLDWIRHV